MEENNKKKITLMIIGVMVLLVILITSTYAYFSAKSEAEKQLNEKVSQILSDNEYILNKKVLQTNKLDNSLEVVYFLALLEQIGEQQSF